MSAVLLVADSDLLLAFARVDLLPQAIDTAATVLAASAAVFAPEKGAGA